MANECIVKDPKNGEKFYIRMDVDWYNHRDVINTTYGAYVMYDPWIRRTLRYFLGQKIVPKIFYLTNIYHDDAN